MSKYKLTISAFLAILFHVSGLIGMLYTDHKDWFIANTPLNLILMAALLVWNQPKPNKAFLLFLLAAFLTGMGSEMIGVNTGKLFGCYHYGQVLGPHFNGVPWLIGVNWFVIVYCSGVIMQKAIDWMSLKYEESGGRLSKRMVTISLVLDGALLTVFFDWVMEPVAVKLGFWQWEGGLIPFFNYLCWFLISAALLLLFRYLRFDKTNHFAVHLFIIQLLFFLTLRWHL
ncbi:MAG: carotenoid biosynthesis protein [Sediminibacterium sp.]|nr:carotenoid biosynthesis protein [Sediminibacterium sp.]